MVSQQTQTRDNKINLFKSIIGSLVEILILPKGSLNRIDMREIKQVSKKVNGWHERAKPAP
jgi:hypothetical protein